MFRISWTIALWFFNSLAFSQEGLVIDNLKDTRAPWTVFTDAVMGGVSEGELVELEDSGSAFYRLQGDVSTKNNGGFIQYRTKTELKGTKYEGIRIKVRGNDNEYFIHVRTRATIFPWDYYSASFEVTDEWSVIVLPFQDFSKSSWRLPKKIRSSGIKSIGLVAFGKDFSAELDLASIELY